MALLVSGPSRLAMAALITSSCALLGCNNLTGLDAIEVETIDDAAPVTGGNVSGPVGLPGEGDQPAPKLLNCEYPAGNPGVDVSQTVPREHQWTGWAPGASAPDTVYITEFFDCDGSKGIDAVIFDTSQYG